MSESKHDQSRNIHQQDKFVRNLAVKEPFRHDNNTKLHTGRGYPALKNTVQA
jgi:hypothetical protein